MLEIVLFLLHFFTIFPALAKWNAVDVDILQINPEGKVNNTENSTLQKASCNHGN